MSMTAVAKKLTLTFGSNSVEVVGSGRTIERSGWERLSVIVGTGNVMGTRGAEVVAPKENGIGSKNFGLRSLFRFGDEIHVRSSGQVALLDLQTQETGRAPDPQSRGLKGVRLFVPYRMRSTEALEAFTVEREAHALELMATSMPDTLLKLAHSGKKSGLREVNVRSIRTGRVLRWRQEASPNRCRASGVSMISRRGRMSDGDARVISFQEEEFTRTVELPAEYVARRFPSYYKAAGGRVKIAVSVPISRRKIDAEHCGHFHYPLKAPASRTGCPVSVSAPFDLNQDRSGLNDLQWNDWLIDQAIELVMDLLISDWFVRYGADAFSAVAAVGASTPNRFATMLAGRLREDACWPTRAKGEQRLSKASEIVLPSDDLYAGFLGDARSSNRYQRLSVRAKSCPSCSRNAWSSLVEICLPSARIGWPHTVPSKQGALRADILGSLSIGTSAAKWMTLWSLSWSSLRSRSRLSRRATSVSNVTVMIRSPIATKDSRRHRTDACGVFFDALGVRRQNPFRKVCWAKGSVRMNTNAAAATDHDEACTGVPRPQPGNG